MTPVDLFVVALVCAAAVTVGIALLALQKLLNRHRDVTTVHRIAAALDPDTAARVISANTRAGRLS